MKVNKPVRNVHLVLKGKYHANLLSFQNPQNVCLLVETKE